MNRYTFKAKRKDNGEWVYGYYLEMDNKSLIVTGKETKKVNYLNGYLYYWEQVEIDKETLCQCTGLQDIDGKDIFENDIISSNANLGYGKKQKKVEIISQVIYLILNDKTMSGLDTNQCSMFTTRQLNKEQEYTNMDWSVFFNCKIIGNKFDKEED